MPHLLCAPELSLPLDASDGDEDVLDSSSFSLVLFLASGRQVVQMCFDRTFERVSIILKLLKPNFHPHFEVHRMGGDINPVHLRHVMCAALLVLDIIY